MHRGKALWSFIYTTMQHKQRFDKLKKVISKFSTENESELRRNQRMALEKFFNMHAIKKGTSPISLEETFGKQYNEQLNDSLS